MDAIHVITTRRGREAIETKLLSPGSGRYFRYLDEYGIPAGEIDFGYRNIHTIRDEEGFEIDDIGGEDENERLLRTCLDLTFRLTVDPGATVFFSIAGGRKTMSACLMVAAQLYARPQDRIYHVLVSPEFESSENFFYPPRIPGPVELTDHLGRRVIRESGDARITLLHIPFIAIRSRLAPDHLQLPADPETLLATLVRDDPHGLTVNLSAGTITYKCRELPLMPARLALFAFFALRKKTCAKPVRTCRNCTDCYLDFSDISDRQCEITALYRRITGSRDIGDMSDSGITGLTSENFNSYKGKIRRDLADAFGLHAAGPLTIEGRGKKPDTRYGIRLDRDRIRVVV